MIIECYCQNHLDHLKLLEELTIFRPNHLIYLNMLLPWLPRAYVTLCFSEVMALRWFAEVTKADSATFRR